MNKNLYIFTDMSSYRLFKLIPDKNNDDEFFCFPVSLAHVYIPKDYTDRELFQTAKQYNSMEVFDKLKSLVHLDFSLYDKVIFYHGRYASDMLSLYMLADLITSDNMYEVDIDNTEYFKSEWKSYSCTGELSDAKFIDTAYHTFTKKVSQEEKLIYKKEWDKWRMQGNYAFITHDYGKDLRIITFEELDRLIYDEMSRESRFWKIVGKLMTAWDDNCPDWIIRDRILDKLFNFEINCDISIKIKPEDFVTNCRYYDGTIECYDELLMMAEYYLDQAEEPSLMEFEQFVDNRV